MNEQLIASHPLCSIVLDDPCFKVNHGDRRFTIESTDFEGRFRIRRVSTDQSPQAFFDWYSQVSSLIQKVNGYLDH